MKKIGSALGAVAILFALTSCDDGGVFGGESTASVQGQWIYSAQHTGSNCEFSATLSLSQTGEGFTGEVTDRSVTCDDQTDLPPTSIEAGRIDGDSVFFDLNSFRHVGAVRGGQMSGAARDGNFEFQSGPTSVTSINGDATWEATRP